MKQDNAVECNDVRVDAVVAKHQARQRVVEQLAKAAKDKERTKTLINKLKTLAARSPTKTYFLLDVRLVHQRGPQTLKFACSI